MVHYPTTSYALRALAEHVVDRIANYPDPAQAQREFQSFLDSQMRWVMDEQQGNEGENTQ